MTDSAMESSTTDLRAQCDKAWDLTLTIRQLSALVNTIEKLDCFEKTLPKEIEQVHRLIGATLNIAHYAESLGEEVCDIVDRFADRFSYPKQQDCLPGELLLKILDAATNEGDDLSVASTLALSASDLARYAEHDESLYAPLQFLLDQIRERGYNPKINHYENIGMRVELYTTLGREEARRG